MVLDFKFNLVIMRGGTPIFITMKDLASWWTITYNGGTFHNLKSQQIKFYIGMHYRYQLLYVLNVINSFCISSMLYSIDQQKLKEVEKKLNSSFSSQGNRKKWCFASFSSQ